MLDSTSSESELLWASMRGNANAFEAIVQRYQSLVCAITFGATANVDKSEELAHEAFIRAWTNLAQLEDLAKFRAWLCTIARNIVRNYIRSKKRDVIGRAASLDKIRDMSCGRSEPVEAVIDKEQQAVIRRALEQMPERYREPLILFYREQKSLKQVAELLELSEEAARTRVSRGRKLLRTQVATMVEDVIGRTGPGKAFTAGVVATIGGMAIKGSAVATAVGGGTASGMGVTAVIKSVMSGVTAKIIAIAAVAAIGVGAAIVYKQTTMPEPEPSSVVQNREGYEGNRAEDAQDPAQINAAQMLVAESADSDTNISDEPDSTVAEVDVAESSGGDSNAVESNTGVSGVVVDKRTSEPIRGAQVFFRLSGEARSVVSDPNGRFELVGLPPGERQFVYVIAKGYTTRRVVLAIEENKILPDLKIELTEGARVAGVVRDEDGKPVAGARVKTFHFTNHPVTTGDDGRFEIEGLDPAFGTYYMQAVHPNYPAVQKSFPAPKTGQAAPVQVVLKSGGAVHGRVTDGRGNPVAGVLVGNTTSRGMWNCLTGRTDAEGMYRLKNVPVGELILWAIADEYAPYAERLSLENSQTEKLADIQLADPRPLRGRIVDTEGNAVPGATVRIWEYKGVRSFSAFKDQSDSGGVFVIRNAPATGNVEINVYGEGIARQDVMLDMGREEYVITVRRTSKLYAKVVDDKTGTPITRFHVKLSRTRIGSNPGRGYAATWSDEGHTFDSAEGFFETGERGLEVGAEYRLTVYAEGFDPVTIDPLVMPPMSSGSDRTEFRLKLPEVIVGRIVDSNDVPIADARIRFMTDQNKFHHYDDRDTTFSNSKGEFNLGGREAVKMCIYITAVNYGSFLGSSLNLPRDSEGSVRIVLGPGAEVYGTVLGPDGQGVTNARVSAHVFSWRMREILSSPYPSLIRTVTDANGYYEFLDLPAGPLSFRVSSSLIAGQKRMNLEPGQSLELNFGDESGHTLTGTVRIGQKLLESAEVTVLLPDRSKDGHTDGEGRFFISGVPDGTYEVAISYYDSTTEDWFDDKREVVVDGDTELDFDLGNGTVSGRIPERFVGAEGLKVYVRRWAPKTLRDNIGLCTDWEPARYGRVTIAPEGNFKCPNLRAGRYFLLLRTKQATQGISDVFELTESEHVEGVAFNTGNARLQISVIDLDTGEDVPQAAFAVQNELNANFSSWDLSANKKRQRMTTDDRGKAEYTGLPRGTYIVRVDMPRYIPANSEWIDLVDGETGSATVYLERAAVARFEVSPEVLRRVTSERAYLRCRVIDPDTGRLIPKPTPMLSYYKEYDEHTLPIVGDDLPEYIQPEIYLPEGWYEIEYRLYQDRKGYINTSRPPMIAGVANVELIKGKTTTILVTDD